MRQRVLTSTVSLAIATIFALIMLAGLAARAQTYSVIYSFTGHDSAQHPVAGVTLDRQGNLYGTTLWGGRFGAGTVYELKPAQSGFAYSELYDFGNASDGAFPWGGITIGPNGTLYGTTASGGTDGDGTVFTLRPPLTVCRSVVCYWDEAILYNFTGGSDGRNPQAGVTFDGSGNFYGTNVNGGSSGAGVVYEMTPSHGGWSYLLLYPFSDGQDGANPSSLLMFDAAGNLYGTAASGGLPGCSGFGCGTVYELSRSGSGWTEKTLYSFHDGSDGAAPAGGLLMDSAGHLYGATPGSNSNGGSVFELSPAGGSWTFNLAYDLVGSGPGPVATLVRDSAGSLYGATWGDGAYGQGVVFKLTPSNGVWTYTSLHDFTGGADGGNAEGGLVMDSNGNLYGTTYQGGLSSCGHCGVVFEIKP